jgi:predicted PurR-regulated permease PerM
MKEQEIRKQRELAEERKDRMRFLTRVLMTVAVVATVTLLILLTLRIFDVILLIFAGVLVALVLRSMSNWIRDKTGLSDGIALTVVVLGLLGVVGTAGWLMAPSVVGQANMLMEELPRAADELQEDIARHHWGRQVLDFFQDGGTVVPQEPAEIAARARGVFSTMTGALVAIFVILFVGVFLAADPQTYRNGILRLVPPEKRPRAQDVLDALVFTMKRWLLGRIIVMVIVGLVTWIGLAMLGVPLALVLAVLAGILEFIPNFGPILASVPAILIAWTESSTLALYVILLYLAIQQAESFILTPLVLKETVKLPPVLTIAALLSMGALLGPAGVLLATPVTAAVLVLVKKLYVEDTLGDEGAEFSGGDLEEESEKPGNGPETGA